MSAASTSNAGTHQHAVGAAQAQGGVLEGAAALGYSIAAAWEQTAALSTEQEAVVDAISACCAQHAAQGAPGAAEAAAQPAAEGVSAEQAPLHELQGQLDDVVLQTSSQFHRWHSELEAARAAETEEKYRDYAATLQQHLDACGKLTSKVDEALSCLEALRGQHRDVMGRTRTLTDSCERLVIEKERLVGFADELRSRLSFFEELERIGSAFHHASLAVSNEQILPLLQRLDECIEYVARHPQYADSPAYAGRFRQLQQRALATMRAKVQQVLRSAADQVAAVLRDGGPSTTARQSSLPHGTPEASKAAAQLRPAEGMEQTLLYVRFRAAAEPHIKGMLRGIRERAQRTPEYAQLLMDCQRLYCDVRLALVAPAVERGVAGWAGEPLPSLARHGCSHLMQVCQQEHQLHRQIFGDEHAETDGGDDEAPLSALVDPLCTALYDALRPRFIQLQDLDDLCELVDVLQREVLEEQLERRGNALAPMRAVLQRTVEDVQERLTFRAQAFIRDEVAGYQPSPGDLDYPAQLQRAIVAAGRQQQLDTGQDGAPPELNGQEVLDGDAQDAAPFPPVQATLACLAKLYPSLGSRIFSGLAQEAVAACTLTVQAASRSVAKQSGLLDGQLFMVRQLLTLRECIAPFEADFAVMEYDLDFTHMRDHLRRIMAGKASLFTLGANNAMLQFVSRGGPRILESHVDSKKELEKQLKATCEAFIMAATKLAVEPMLSFITKVTAVRVAGAGTRPLREQAFAAPARLEDMATRVSKALQSALPQAVAKMRLYVTAPAAQAALLKPIKSNIAEAHAQIAALLEAEYRPEEQAQIRLTPPQELDAMLSL